MSYSCRVDYFSLFCDKPSGKSFQFSGMEKSCTGLFWISEYQNLIKLDFKVIHINALVRHAGILSDDDNVRLAQYNKSFSN